MSREIVLKAGNSIALIGLIAVVASGVVAISSVIIGFIYYQLMG